MTHRLTPTAQASTRSLDDLIETLRDSFAFVEADRERGADHIGDMITHYLRMKDGYSRWKEPPPEAAELEMLMERLEVLRDHAALMVVADDASDENQSITFNLVPGEDIIIGYADQTHQDTARPIAMRVAEELGYHAEEV